MGRTLLTIVACVFALVSFGQTGVGTQKSQELKIFKGKIDLLKNSELDIEWRDLDAEYQYNLDNDEKLHKSGYFRASKVDVYSESTDKLGYSSNVSDKTLKKVSGQMKNDKKEGVWKKEVIRYGMKITGAAFNALQNNWTTTNVDMSQDVESIETRTVNYVNDLADGEITYQLINGGKVVSSSKYYIKNGHYIGQYSERSANSTRDLMFDNNGYIDGEMYELYDNVEKKSHYSHGVLVDIVVHNKSTGEKMLYCKNPIAEYLQSNKLPDGFRVDTLEITPQNNETIVLDDASGESSKYSLTNGTLVYDAHSSNKPRHLYYDVFPNCNKNHHLIFDFNGDTKIRDLFLVSNKKYFKEQVKGSNSLLYIKEIDSLKNANHGIEYVEAPSNEVLAHAEQMPTSSYDFHDYIDKNLHCPCAFRIIGYVLFVVNVDGSISDVKFQPEGNQNCCNGAIEKVVEQMPKWMPGKQYGELARVKINQRIDFYHPDDYHAEKKISAIINFSMVFFYDKPDRMTQRKDFVRRGETVSIFENSGEYTHCTYTDKGGKITDGWIETRYLR